METTLSPVPYFSIQPNTLQHTAADRGGGVVVAALGDKNELGETQTWLWKVSDRGSQWWLYKHPVFADSNGHVDVFASPNTCHVSLALLEDTASVVKLGPTGDVDFDGCTITAATTERTFVSNPGMPGRPRA